MSSRPKGDLTTEHGIKFNEFKVWLRQNTDLTERTVCDMISRLKRLTAFINPLSAPDSEMLYYLIRTNEHFKNSSPSVRSQLKRAGTLYREFYFKKGVEQ
ncbi:MAG: hypothetical protein P9L94_13240 [Candidatus Hinthialibacter antarcticus]|nr:hypothetical protein [Candidatus Hinthialibacter antarcticus]